MAKPTREQLEEMKRVRLAIREHDVAGTSGNKTASKGITKKQFHEILDKSSQPITRPESDSKQP
jgi:hypothetical protein